MWEVRLFDSTHLIATKGEMSYLWRLNTCMWSLTHRRRSVSISDYHLVVSSRKKSLLSHMSPEKRSPRRKQMAGSYFPSGNSAVLPQHQDTGQNVPPGLAHWPGRAHGWIWSVGISWCSKGLWKLGNEGGYTATREAINEADLAQKIGTGFK